MRDRVTLQWVVFYGSLIYLALILKVAKKRDVFVPTKSQQLHFCQVQDTASRTMKVEFRLVDGKQPALSMCVACHNYFPSAPPSSSDSEIKDLKTLSGLTHSTNPSDQLLVYQRMQKTGSTTMCFILEELAKAKGFGSAFFHYGDPVANVTRQVGGSNPETDTYQTKIVHSMKFLASQRQRGFLPLSARLLRAFLLLY